MTTPLIETTPCPHCQHPNPVGSTQCAKCGQTLTTLTVFMPHVAITAPPLPEGVLVNLASNTLILMVAGHKTPITMERKPDIRFGRAATGQPAPDVDLTPYNGYKLGVSRVHAVIHCVEKTCTLEDLGSANGTWLNEVKLVPGVAVPLENGGQVRLGHLNISVYFTDKDKAF